MATTIPISEIFGPTIQGEGPVIGVPAIFIRVAGCPNNCAWCDTPYAQTTEGATDLTITQIVDRVKLAASWRDNILVTITGGSPLMYADAIWELIGALPFQVALETEFLDAELLPKDPALLPQYIVVSPKPPSSGVLHDEAFIPKLDAVLYAACETLRVKGGLVSLKFAVDTSSADDISFVRRVLSTLTAIVHTCVQPVSHLTAGYDSAALEEYLNCLRSLVETILADPVLCRASILPQLQCLLWGMERGK